jgi:hypothetical protein
MTVADRVRLFADIRLILESIPTRTELRDMAERDLYVKVLRRIGYGILAAFDRHYEVK